MMNIFVCNHVVDMLNGYDMNFMLFDERMTCIFI